MVETLAPDAVALHCASPYIAGNAPLVRRLMGEYARGLLEIALERCDGAIGALTPDLRRHLAAVLDRPLPWAAVWHPALAELEAQASLAERPEAVWDAIVPMLVNLAAAGRLAEAELRLQRPQRLWWGGIQLPMADRLSFRRRPHSVALELRLGRGRARSHVLRRSANGLWSSSTLAAAPTLWLGRHPVIAQLYDGAPYDVQYKSPRIRESLPPGAAAIFAEATRLLRRVNPALVPWVADVVRMLMPLETGPAMGRMSSTIEEFPGLTVMSLPLPPSEVAVRLVHEASHHYFLALKRLVDLDDGSDKTQYHSPIKERGRTIDMILFAFHAFGNGALFHRDLAQSDPRYERVADDTVEEAFAPLRIMHDFLGQTRALTPAGKTLWQPVAERLFG
jgi:HEXXH motif-containing protein